MHLIKSYKYLILLLIFPVLSLSHHSRSEFSTESLELQGILTNVIWRNPHAALEIMVVNTDGSEESWRIETFGSPNLFARMGVEREMFEEGDYIRVSGMPSTMRDNYLLGTNVLFQNGLEAILSSNLDPVWSDTYVGGSGASDRFADILPNTQDQNQGLFRNWSIAGYTVGVSRDLPFTEEAILAQEMWNPIESPIVKCESPGMPMPMNQPLGFEFVQIDDYLIELNIEYFGLKRQIHLNPSLNEVLPDPSPLGYSIGYWEAGNLHVETSRIDYPYFNIYGAPQSKNIQVFETFMLSEDQSRLEYKIEIIDNLTFSRAATAERLYLALGEPFIPLNCEYDISDF
ncbi:MAG: hypothetical protein CMQ51_06640 [Gammaproteobacteria bacterium]|nr:hypothetical protein [Gammaproteobacteria bacterium]|tara:strand:+ start:293 stop:1324 length:1032 start_codon:yes stop_codon:yes gene_type:complete